MNLWFDLELTLINDWDNPFIVNADKIFNFLKSFPNARIGVFSFVMWDDEHRDKFNKQIRPHLENFFNISFDDALIPTKKEIHKIVNEQGKSEFFMKGRVDFMDFFEFWGKERAFIDWCRASQTGMNILIDDMIPNASMKFPECEIQMFRI